MTAPLKVLILDDSADDAKLMQRALRGGGLAFTATHVEAREAFLAALGAERFDVLLADYKIPDFGGAEALKIARERCPDMPAILVTGALPDDMAVELLREGASDYVLKDRLSRLAPAVRRAIDDAAVRAEAKRAEQALQLSEERFRSLAETAPVGIFRIDAQGGVLYVNRRWREMTGLSAESVRGSGWAQAVPVEDRAALERKWADTVASGSSFDGELRFRRPDGVEVWVYARAVPERDAGGILAGYIGVTTDISLLKQAEHRLEEQLDELRRFQRVTVDREVRMQELEVEITLLRQARH